MQSIPAKRNVVAIWLPITALVGTLTWICIAGLYRLPHPPVGFYIALLAFVAALVTLFPPENKWTKAAWLIVFGAMLVLELSTLYSQRREDRESDNQKRIEEDNRFAKLLTDEHNNFSKVLREQEGHFAEVLGQDQRDFRATIGKLVELGNSANTLGRIAQQSLEKVSERENVLFPLALPSPAPPISGCVGSPAIFAGGNMFTGTFPLNVFSINDTPLLSVHKAGNGGALVTFSIFDDRGDIIAHADKNSYWVRSDTRIDKPNMGHLIVHDHRDQVVLDVEYTNPHVMRISGILRHPDFPTRPVPIERPGVTGNCMGGPNGIDVTVR